MSGAGVEHCAVCGAVEGRVPHVEEEIGNLEGVRLQRAKEYVLDHTEHTDAALIPWETTSEAITHIQQLRNRELGQGCLAEIEGDTASTEV